MSRAVDAHIVLRPHEEPGCVVMEAALRSFAPLTPLPLRWEFPLWTPDASLDPDALVGRKTKGEERQSDRDREGCEAILAALADGPATERIIRDRTALSRDRCRRLLSSLERNGEIDGRPTTVRGNATREYTCTPDTWSMETDHQTT